MTHAHVMWYVLAETLGEIFGEALWKHWADWHAKACSTICRPISRESCGEVCPTRPSRSSTLIPVLSRCYPSANYCSVALWKENAIALAQRVRPPEPDTDKCNNAFRRLGHLFERGLFVNLSTNDSQNLL